MAYAAARAPTGNRHQLGAPSRITLPKQGANCNLQKIIHAPPSIENADQARDPDLEVVIWHKGAFRVR
jgi:hypothetical protein